MTIEASTEKEVVSKKKKKFAKDDLITIFNYTAGTCFYQNPRTQQEWKLVGFGATEQMTLDELISLKSSQPKFLKEPYLLVMDDDAVEQLSLEDVYKRILKPDEIGQFYEKMTSSQMENFLDNASESMKDLLVTLTTEKIASREFGDLFKIRLIESKLNMKLLD